MRPSDFNRVPHARALTGFDGVEVHGANGYLIDQFLRSGSNHRTDVFGGPARNRARFRLEVAEAITAIRGLNRESVRV